MNLMILNMYMCHCIFFTPYLDKFFTVFISSSIQFSIEVFLMNKYYNQNGVSFALFQIPQYLILMFLVAYFIRKTLTQFFVLQIEAEQTVGSLTQILDNLPDAVLMVEESEGLSYCNQQADKFFDVDLSHLTTSKEKDLEKSQYLIVDNRCFHELK